MNGIETASTYHHQISFTGFNCLGLSSRRWRIEITSEGLPRKYGALIEKMWLPVESGIDDEQSLYRWVELWNLQGPRGEEGYLEGNTMWQGRTGPGVIFIEMMLRARDSFDPWMSHLTKAIYHRDSSLATLKHLIFLDIDVLNTWKFVTQNIYKPWTALSSCQVWEPGSKEFEASLGTRPRRCPRAALVFAGGGPVAPARGPGGSSARPLRVALETFRGPTNMTNTKSPGIA
ncbi:hypothetical protein N7532_009774 [Penicillium argentinense]|uniref:Uncharacterized protein n=1 Tax=Penicillium argentinense TaxID=1131581 RepID=A0A9W9JXB0_9EURO|nr:uncharacterized protein N7532_009774 [Penicillium argentinense]KAJ5085003.1 hypothetical protein N7532_009774 [Penicillium argentinense]